MPLRQWLIIHVKKVLTSFLWEVEKTIQIYIFFLNGLLIIVLSVFVSIFLKTNSRYKETQNSYPLMHVIFLS